ncbi:MAG: hypothetical protein ACK5KP_08410 [Paludibacteraceae bacterium]
MKKFFYLFLIVGLISCSGNEDITEDLRISSASEYQELARPLVEELNSLVSTPSSSSGAMERIYSGDNSAQSNEYKELIKLSHSFLLNLGIDIEEDGEFASLIENDHRIILMAIVLSNIEISESDVSGRNNDTRTLSKIPSIQKGTGVGNCLLEAVGINALVNGAAKKVIAKKLLSRIVPYAGWAIAAIDFADCMW